MEEEEEEEDGGGEEGRGVGGEWLSEDNYVTLQRPVQWTFLDYMPR